MLKHFFMIKTFKDKQLEECWRYGISKGIKNDLKRRVLMKLDSINAATCLKDLQNPPGNNLHKLKGEFDGFWAISVSGPWRLIFKIINTDIYDVMLIQYH